MEPTNEPLILRNPSPPANGTLTLIFGGEFCASREVSRGSECDSLDDSAFHLFLLDSARKPLACRRLHFNAPDEALVRFMAVDENALGRGYVSRILEGLEAEAMRRGAQKLVLNARDSVTEFYAKHDYEVFGQAETLFGAIRHVRMEKILS